MTSKEDANMMGEVKAGHQWPEVRALSVNQLIEALAAGIRDLRNGGRFSLFFGAFYALGGVMLVALAQGLRMPYLIYPAAMGFVLVAPFVATGLYDISRRLEQNDRLSWQGIFGAIRHAASRDLRWMALIASFTFVIWMDIAAMLTLALLDIDPGITIKELLAQIFTTPSGLLFLAIGNSVGAGIALAVFSFSAVSFPMLYDRDIDFVTAMVTSVRLVLKNPAIMITWGFIIAVTTLVSILSAFIGLVFVLPIFGHASWHLYRMGVAPDPIPAPSASHP